MEKTCSEKKTNVHDVYRGFSDEHLKMFSSLPFRLMIYNCHGDFNTGVLIRTACCLGATTVYTVGRRKFDRRTLVGSQNYINIERLDILEPDPVAWFQKQMLFPVFIEQNGTDIDVFDFRQLFNSDLTPCLVVGSECDGIPEEFISLFPDSPRLSIGQPGVIRSLNVACAGSIAIERMYYSLRHTVTSRYGLF